MVAWAGWPCIAAAAQLSGSSPEKHSWKQLTQALAGISAAWLQIRLLLGMLCASPWRYFPLTLQFLSQQHSDLPEGEQSRTPCVEVLH
jgi:hypothetical protein